MKYREMTAEQRKAEFEKVSAEFEAWKAKGLKLNRETLRLEVVDVVDGDASQVIVHDETNKSVANMLIDMPFPEFPVALGVIYCDPAPSFDEAVTVQETKLKAGKTADLNALLRRGQSWEVH